MNNGTERRAWQRIPLAIPVFVGGTDKSGKQFLDFTVALNVSAGGALVISRHALARSAKLSLEIPTSPKPKLPLPEPSHIQKARVIRMEDKEAYNLYALRFNHPLI